MRNESPLQHVYLDLVPFAFLKQLRGLISCRFIWLQTVAISVSTVRLNIAGTPNNRRGGLSLPDETVGQLRFTGILVSRRVSDGSDSLLRLYFGLPFRQARRALNATYFAA